MVDPEGDPGERHDEDRGKVGLEDEEANLIVVASSPKIIWSLLKAVGHKYKYIWSHLEDEEANVPAQLEGE